MAKPRQKVFLIEDELDIMYVYKTALKAAGIDVEGLSTGKEAMEKLKEVQAKKAEKPWLVLLDLVLPDINGLEILRAIREHPVTKDTLVFILSNYTSDALYNLQYVKPDRCILKAGITPTQLASLVTEAMKKSNASS